MRLPGISDNAEVSLWDETQFVVGGLSVSINFEPCTNRGFDAASPNERAQHYQLPEPSILILCETYFPLQAVIFSGRDWQPEELVFLDFWLLEMGWELEQLHRDGQPHRGPLRAGEVVLFAPGFEGENLHAIDPETGYTAWFKWYGESLFLLAATDETAVVASWKSSVIAVDATNGDERWRAEFGEYARVTRAVALDNGEWLIAIEFTNEGDPSPPQLARLDAHGSVLWTAAGREGTDWAWDDPIVSSGRAFMRDVPHAWADAGPVSVTAFDIETGDLLWRTELDSTSEGYPTRSLAISHTQRIVPHRPDSREGTSGSAGRGNRRDRVDWGQATGASALGARFRHQVRQLPVGLQVRRQPRERTTSWTGQIVDDTNPRDTARSVRAQTKTASAAITYVPDDRPTAGSHCGSLGGSCSC